MGSVVADLRSWGSLFQTEAAAAMTKAWSTIEECWVARTASKDDAAERRCFQPGASAMHHMSDDKYLGAVPLMHWNIRCCQFKSNPQKINQTMVRIILSQSYYRINNV